jgi:Predicted signal transduction protein with a C-terminal ATPase domain
LNKLFFQNFSIKRKMQFIIFACIFVISISSFTGIFAVSNSNRESLYQPLTGYLSYSGTELSKQLDALDNIADMIFSNATIQDMLVLNKSAIHNSERNIAQSGIYTRLVNYVFDFDNRGINYITIFQDDDVFSSSISSTAKLPDDVKSHLIEIGKNNRGATHLVTDYCQEYGLFLVKEIYEYRNLNLNNLGVLLVNIDLNTLINTTVAINSPYENVSYFLYEGQRLLYSNNNSILNNTDKLVTNQKEGYQIVNLNNSQKNENIFAVYGSVPNQKWNFIVTVPYTDIMSTTTFTLKSVFFAIALCVLLTLIVSSSLITKLLNHLELLTQKMQQFGNNTYTPKNSPIDYSLREDEVGLLHTTFDNMVIQLNHLITENYTNELLKKEAQIKAMESQMEPHFLYNTLDSINWRAQVIHAESISRATIALGNLLRITLDKRNSQFTLHDEIRTLEYYFTIQKLRYEKRLNYSINIPENLMDCEIPKLTLQPLVENAVRYGLEAISETCHITITSKSTDDTILIEIKNNGSSFDENLLKDLIENRVLTDGFGIGIINIHKRIQLLYGEMYGLYLYNIFDKDTGEEYACVQIKFPKKLSKKMR